MFPAGRGSGLMDDRNAHTVEDGSSDLGENGPKFWTVIVPMHSKQDAGAPLKRGVHRRGHPITGVNHEVRRVDRGPELCREVPRATRHMRVGHDH